MTSTGQSNIEHCLIAEAQALEERLATRDPEFRQLQVIRRALTDLAAARGEGLRDADGAAGTGRRYASGINEAALFLIEEAGEPLAVAEIFVRLPKYGKIPAGKRPQWLLSNLMSADKNRFRSVNWKGRRRWWVKDQPLPKEGQSED